MQEKLQAFLISSKYSFMCPLADWLTGRQNNHYPLLHMWAAQDKNQIEIFDPKVVTLVADKQPRL